MQATQKIAVPSIPLQFPQSVPAKEVTQQELIDIIEARNTCALLEKHVKSLEDTLKARLQAGAPVEAGVHVAEVKPHSRRTPAWKEVVCTLAKTLGFDPDAYCENVIAATSPSTWFSLEIH